MKWSEPSGKKGEYDDYLFDQLCMCFYLHLCTFFDTTSFVCEHIHLQMFVYLPF